MTSRRLMSTSSSPREGTPVTPSESRAHLLPRTAGADGEELDTKPTAQAPLHKYPTDLPARRHVELELVRDAVAEDLDTTSEDHAGDDWRYACMSRPWV